MIVSLAELYPKYREDIETCQFLEWMNRQGIEEEFLLESLYDEEFMLLIDKFYAETSLLH